MSAISASWLYCRHPIRSYTYDVHLSPRHHRPARAEGEVSDGYVRGDWEDERKVMRVYLDNNLLGPNAEEHEAETEAFHAIEAEWLAGRWRLEWMVSRRTANELEKTRDLARRGALRAAYDAATLLDDDHTVEGFSNVDLGALGSVALRGIGLHNMDARHLTAAIHNRCEAFLTTDKKILKRRAKIAAQYHIDVMAPSNLRTRLSLERHGGT